MGHSKLNLAIVAAGFMTLGFAVGIGPTAEAAPLALSEVVVQATYAHHCAEWRVWDSEGAIVCLDCDEVYEAGQYEADGDGLLVWK
jgi:hypothetical protein